MKVKLLHLTFKALDDLDQLTSSHNSLQYLVSDGCGGRVCTTGCASAGEEGYQEAGVRSGGLYGQEGSMVEGKTGQGQSPFSSVRAFSGNP